MNSFLFCLLKVAVSISFRQMLLMEIRWRQLYWVTTEKWRHTINRADSCLKTLETHLTILEFNSCWFVSSVSNCCFIKRKLLMKIREVTNLLEKWRQTISWSEDFLKALDMKLAILEINFCFERLWLLLYYTKNAYGS